MTPTDPHSIAPRPSAGDDLPLERLLTKREVATLLGVCPRTVDNFIGSRKLRVVRLGTRTMIDPADLREFIDAMKSK
jgi:excisionase family DNA binding protein